MHGALLVSPGWMQHHGFLGGATGHWVVYTYLVFFFSEAYGVEGGLLALRIWSKWQPGNKRYLVDSSSSLSTRGLFISWHLVQTGVQLSR